MAALLSRISLLPRTLEYDYRGRPYRFDGRVGEASHDGKHLFCTIPTGDRRGVRGVRAVAFGQGERLAELRGAGRAGVDLAGTLRREWWQDEERLEFHVRDFRPAASRQMS